MHLKTARHVWLALVLVVLLAAAMPAGAAAIVVGSPPDPGSGNCFPFGCNYSGEYQQVYGSTQFSGPITITGLAFYNTQSDMGASSMNSGNWAISLSTTSADWNTLSGTYAGNIGADNALVFSGNLFRAWSFGDTLSISLSTPFTYNPLNGNLLLDVFVTGASSPGGGIYFDTNGYNGGGFNGNDYLGRVYGSGDVNGGYGLVTGFNNSISAVPEPGTMALVGLVLTGLGLVIRRRTK